MNSSEVSITNSSLNYTAQHPLSESSEKKVYWHERAIERLEYCENKLDQFLPNFAIQDSFDQIGCEEVEEAFNQKDYPTLEFNQWLDSNGAGDWYERLAIFLAKLPLRAARNILRLVVDIVTTLVKWSSYAVVHPLKAPLELAKKFVYLIYALTQPETWSRIGATAMGASLGQSLAAGNPLSAITFGIAAAMTIGGVSIGTLKAALQSHREDRTENIKRYLLSELHHLPEMMLTGLCTGLLIGGIQRMVRSIQHNTAVYNKRYTLARDQAAAFAKENGYPDDFTFNCHQDSTTISWDLETHPELRYVPELEIKSIPHYKVGPITSPKNIVIYVDKITIVARKTIPLKGWVEPPMPPVPGLATWNNNLPRLSTAYTLSNTNDQ